MDTALTKVSQIVAKLEEAERHDGGLAATWTPAEATEANTVYILSGEITDLPITIDSGWFQKSPVLTIELTARPFLYGGEVAVASSSSTDPAMTYTLAGVTGDVPAEARLIVTDNATQSRRHVEWGIENRHYDAATSLLLDSDSLVTSGFAGTGTTLTGAYDPGGAGNSVISATIHDVTTAICGTGNQSHVGTFRVKARVQASGASAYVRLSWQEGDGEFSSNPYALVALEDAWVEVDLGLIHVPEKTLGTQRWSGRIEAYTTSTGAGTDTLAVDYLVIIPAGEGYGKARAPLGGATQALRARDRFTNTTAGGALNLRAAPLGGNWATSGVATDFTFADAPSSGETVSRATTGAEAVSGRAALLGATNYTDIEVGVDFQYSAASAYGRSGVVARAADADDTLRFYLLQSTYPQLVLAYDVAGSLTTLATKNFTATGDISHGVWYSFRLLAYSSGYAIGAFYREGVLVAELGAFSSALATAGARATGLPGFFDSSTALTLAGTRYYDNFYAAVPPAEPLVVASGQSAEIRHDSAIREDSTGTYWGPIPSYRGSRFYLPPAGDENRTSRLLVKARRSDIDVAADDQIADSLTVAVNYTPRYLTPR